MVWWRLLLRKPHSWALSLTASSVVSSLSLLCLVSLSVGAIIWPSNLLSYYVSKEFFGCYCSNTKHNFWQLIRVGSFSECWRSANVTVSPNGAPSPDGENYRPISITPILSKVYDMFVSHAQALQFLPVDPNNIRRASGKVGTSIYSIYQRNVWAGWEQTIWMTPRYWQLFASQQTDLLMLPPLVHNTES